jgi:quinol---cytochrome c reductase iron-sulfur subunit, bacillus type
VQNESPQQVPPPSLWPVGFALGVICLLVGVVISWWVAAVGAAVAIVFGFLWVRDVTAARKAQAAPAAPAEAPPAGEAPVDADLSPEERFPRNVFLEGATLGIGAAIGVAVTVPAVGLMVVPAFTKQGHPGIDIGPIGNFPEGQWRVARFLLRAKDGKVSRRTAFIRNNGFLDGKPSFTVISNRCAHLGCPVQPNGLIRQNLTKNVPTAEKSVAEVTPIVGLSGFGCPCHGGAYDTEGNRTAGPPVRALDRYEFSIIDGHVVLGTMYSVANVTGSGANAEIRKQVLAGPGQHIDGIEGWLYPWQPPH